MSDLNHDLHARAVNALSENEVRKMEHCVGFDRKKVDLIQQEVEHFLERHEEGKA